MSFSKLHAHRNRAFTILELLVVIAIIGILVGVLFPALMAARESARCVQCKNHLHEIGIAMQQHHDATKRLPQAWTAANDKYSGYGWATLVLPFLEEADLHKNINSRLPVSAFENDVARNTDLPTLRCPSDISEPMFDLLPEAPHGYEGQGAARSGTDGSPLVRLPISNYLGVFGTLEADESFPAPPGDGAIVANRAVRFTDLQRGQSHTIIVGERTTAMVPSTWYGVDFQGEDAACRLVGSAITAPNCETCDECEFASRHPGGANFVWADGHVSLISDDIDSQEYTRMSQRHVN